MIKYNDILFSKNTLTNKRAQSNIHYHDTYELYLLLDGTVKYLVNDKFYYLSSGDLIIIPANTLHSTDSQSCLHNERLLLSFSNEYFHTDVTECLNGLCEENIICVPKERVPIIEDMFYKIGNEYQNNSPYKNEMIRLYISELIIYMSRYKIPPKSKKFETDILMQQIADYIFSNYRDEISLSVLSREFYLSECYLSRRFKDKMGISIKQYINYVRISKAKELLQGEHTSITEIAMLCGFNDSNYFAGIFKRLTGVTPLKYYKSHSAKK